MPPALLLLYRVIPPPVTPLMLIRSAEGYGIDRDWVALEEVSPDLIEAVVAAEDNLFCEHAGFDLDALEGEIRDALAGRPVRGASTITMQTAKNLFLWPDRSWIRKGLEAWLTPQIELLWPKRRILEVYLNIAEFGPGVYGVEAASWVHFGKPSHTLLPEEAARLATILPAPLRRTPDDPFAYERAPTLLKRIDQLGPRLDCTRVATPGA